MIGDMLKFLTKSGGVDTTRFWDEDDKPDILKAREYAEGLRAKLGQTNLVKVSQRVNAVRVRVTEEAMSVA